MEECKETSSKGEEKPPAAGEDSSVDEHPLFMTRVPTASDFKRNSLLSALAALIDEEESEVRGPQRRRRRQARCEPWAKKTGSRSAFPSVKAPEEAGRRINFSSLEHQAHTSSSDPGASLQVTGKLVSVEGKQKAHNSRDGEMECDLMPAKATPQGHTEEKEDVSLGELQICMRLFSMK